MKLLIIGGDITFECPNCKNALFLAFAEESIVTDYECPNCKVIYDIKLILNSVKKVKVKK